MKRPCYVLVTAATVAIASGVSLAADAPGVGDLYPQDTTTPTLASRAPEDLDVSAGIRRALVADESLSTSAKHIQILTNSQAVILRGAVRPQEPEAIEEKARLYSGVRQIINQLTVVDR